MPDQPVPVSAVQPAVVLLVDDSRLVAATVRDMLHTEADIILHHCSTPEEAVALATRLQPTVILQDIIMPGIDGLTLVPRYRAEIATQQIPIIMLSTAEEAQIKANAFAIGANDYLVKLPSKIELIARIRYHSQAYYNARRLDELNRALQALSLEDGLTGVANRRCFDQVLEKEWRRAARDQTTLSLIMLDVDCFKAYNDRYGHQAGDACLRHVAAVVAGALRRPSDVVARYGGEEFAGLLPNTPAAGARLRAETICAAVEALQLLHEGSVVGPHVTISVGVASLIPTTPEEADSLVATADSALYQAKHAGRNRVRQIA